MEKKVVFPLQWLRQLSSLFVQCVLYTKILAVPAISPTAIRPTSLVLTVNEFKMRAHRQDESAAQVAVAVGSVKTKDLFKCQRLRKGAMDGVHRIKCQKNNAMTKTRGQHVHNNKR